MLKSHTSTILDHTECPSKPFKLDGHCGYYLQNFTQYLKDDGEYHIETYVDLIGDMLFNGLFGPSPEPELRFAAVQVVPHLFVKRDARGFTISGPHYSTAAETAKYLNYSIHGAHIVDEDMLHLALDQRTHFAVSDISPVLDITIQMYTGEFVKKGFANSLEKNGPIQQFIENMKLGSITKALGILEMDVVTQYRHTKPKAMFAFVETFGKETWFLILVFALLVSLLLTARHIRYFWLFFEYVILCTFGSPTIKKSHLAPFLVVTWTTMLWVLEQYYGGDMVNAMMARPELNVIDSMEDLYHHHEKVILVPSTQTFGKRDKDEMLANYYQGYKEYGDDFKKRTELFEYLHSMQDDDYILARFYNFSKNEERNSHIGLGYRSWSLFVQNKVILHDCMNRMYLSKEAGDFQPHFFLNFLFADQKLKSAMDYVILCLTESGIYQRWVKWATYNYRDKKAPTPLAEYEVADIGLLYGPGFICLGLLAAAAAALRYENAKSLMAPFRRYLVLKCHQNVQKVNEWQRLRRQQRRMAAKKRDKERFGERGGKRAAGRQRVNAIRRSAPPSL